MLFPVFGVSLVAIGVAIAWYGLRPLVVVPRILRTEVVSPSRVIEAGTDGAFVVCRGTATGDQAVTSPFTGKRCLGFEFEVGERQPSAIGIPWFFAHLDDGVSTHEFRLRDERGELAVEPSAQRFSLDTDSTVVTVGAHETPPKRIANFVEVRDALSPVARWLAAIPGMGTRRYVERRIDPGQEYVIAGRVEQSERTPTLAGPLVITDKSPTGLGLARLKTAVLPVAVALFLIGVGAILILI
ncbi:hypothetical protein [Halovenus salina]|uniref:RING-type E3 ubiquitin transferase n=1 Tax=Halovenus salina TaxID=1510225 RepID=A0ABD5W4K4_9EURY|nr:hypothetical protein [Halovenus salina]